MYARKMLGVVGLVVSVVLLLLVLSVWLHIGAVTPLFVGMYGLVTIAVNTVSLATNAICETIEDAAASRVQTGDSEVTLDKKS